MNNRLKIVLMVAMTAAASACFIASLFPTRAAMAEEEAIFNEKYQGQSTFQCNGQTFKVPPYFAYASRWPNGDFYLTASNKYCIADNFQITLGIGEPGCVGGNSCTQGSFYSTKRSATDWLLSSVLQSYVKEVDLSKNISGYIVPEKCTAFCSQAYIVWFTDTNVFVLGSNYSTTPQETTEELIKAANSYIELKD